MSVEWKVFLNAIEIEDPHERAIFLDQACPDHQIRARVEKMLAFDPASSFLGEDEVPNAYSPRAPESPSALLGHSMGRYTLQAVIGEGGFGVVYRAEQTEPIQRAVALKVIKLGMDTRQVIARFEAERQVLALMDHPNIAKVHDGGASDTGRPYFVMELVDGLPITQFCDENQFTLTQRLRLVAQVCRAVHHAHRKGVIHRDIKPSNVLVARQDNEPVPKIIDFGIAKATQPMTTGQAVVTRYQQLVGTPTYMSPEQFAEARLDVDTRSDVYSIGVLLYELLTGTTPLSEETLRLSTFDQIGRRIRDEPFPKPSTRLQSLGNELESVASDRNTEPARLQRFTKGELDWIVMKALEKDRARRYDSALALAADLDAFQMHEPVEAAPPTLSYRTRTYLRRQWKFVSTVSVVFMLLLLSSIFSMAGFLTASRQIERNRKLLYASDVNLSAAAIESGNIELAEQLLVHHEESDLKSFPWEYVWRQLHQFETKFDHEPPVHDVVFSDDGNSLISLGESGRVCVWDLSDEQPKHRIMPRVLKDCEMATAMTGAVLGSVLAVGGRSGKAWESDGVVELWDWKTGERTRRLDLAGGTGCIVSLQFIPSRSTLLVASVDQLLAYDLKSGEKKWQLKPTSVGYHGTETRALAVSRDGQWIATSNSETGIVILDAATGAQVGDSFDVAGVRCLQFLGDGRLAVGQLLPTNMGALRIIDLESQVVLPPLAANSGCESIDCALNESVLASLNWRGRVTFWDLKSHRQVGSVPAHANAPGAVKFSPDGETLATCGHDGTVKLWATRELLTRVVPPPTPIRETVSWFAFSHDNRTIVSSALASHPKRWDVETGELLTEYTALPASLTSAPQTAFSPDDRLLAAIDTGKRVIIWDAVTGIPERQLQLEATRAHFLLAFSSDAKRLTVGGVEELPGRAFAVQIREWDLEAKEGADEPSLITFKKQVAPSSHSKAGFPHFRIRGGGERDRMRMSPDGKLLAFGIESQLFLADVRSQRVTRFDPMEHVIVPVEFSRDGKYVAVASQSSRICVWHTDTGAMAMEFEAPLWPGVLAFSPDGTTLAAGYYDGAVGLWDLRVAREILQIKAHTFPVTTLKFSSDGKTLASGGWDGEIHTWRTEP